MKNGENNKKISLSARILAGVMAALMFAGVVFGVLSFLIH
jgi:hypothetical protein